MRLKSIDIHEIGVLTFLDAYAMTGKKRRRIFTLEISNQNKEEIANRVHAALLAWEVEQLELGE